MRYRIIAYGPRKECLTWADDANLAQTKQRLEEEGYNDIRVTPGEDHTKYVGSIDYDLFVIDPENQDTTPEQLRDCLYSALTVISQRLTAMEKHLGIVGYKKEGV